MYKLVPLRNSDHKKNYTRSCRGVRVMEKYYTASINITMSTAGSGFLYSTGRKFLTEDTKGGHIPVSPKSSQTDMQT